MRALANFIMAGRLQAMLVAGVSAVASLLLPPITAVLAYVGAGALMLVTLRRGSAEGGLVMAGALAATALFGFLALGQPLPVVAATLILWVPAWIVAVSLRLTVSLPRTLLVATGCGAVMVILAYAWFGDPAVHWRSILEPVIGPALEQSSLNLNDADQQQLIDQAAELMTGAVAAALVFGLLLSLLLARSWQALLYNPGGFRSEFHGLTMVPWMGLVTIGCLLLARYTEGGFSALVLQLGLVALVPHLFVGMAVIHGVAARIGLKPVWLIVIYGLVLFMPQALVIVVVLGLLDGWFRFRSRFAGPGAG